LLPASLVPVKVTLPFANVVSATAGIEPVVVGILLTSAAYGLMLKRELPVRDGPLGTEYVLIWLPFCRC
jgi:hypothetical protein